MFLHYPGLSELVGLSVGQFSIMSRIALRIASGRVGHTATTRAKSSKEVGTVLALNFCKSVTSMCCGFVVMCCFSQLLSAMQVPAITVVRIADVVCLLLICVSLSECPISHSIPPARSKTYQ